MLPPVGTWRMNVLFGVLAFTALAMCARLAALVRDGQDFAVEKLNRQQVMVVPHPGRPGNIFAATRGSYVSLAVSRQDAVCFMDPNLLAQRQDDEEITQICIKLGEFLKIDPVKIQEKVVNRRDERYVPVKFGLTMSEVEAVVKLDLPGVGVQHEWRREYPEGDLAGPVIGFRHDRALKGLDPNIRGGGGLELSLEDHVGGRDGFVTLLTDARRRPLWELSSKPSRDGHNVLLCIDIIIQEYLQTAVAEAVQKYGAKWGVGAVVDPWTGDVLGLASVPSFDPGEFEHAEIASRTNRAISCPYEPGSAFKPIMAASAVDLGVVNWQTELSCENGEYHALKGGRITDHGSHYGSLSVEDIVVFSSNIGMAKIGEKLGNTTLHGLCRKWGFDDKTGICLPGESAGILRHLRKWDGYSLRRVPFGQEISVTAMQLTMAFAAFANGGLLMEPQLVREIRRPDGAVEWKSHPRVIRRVLKESTAQQSLQVLQQVVERGTGKKARLERYSTWGKTGTAQIPSPRGYVPNAYVGTFIGGAPVNKPRLVCMVSLYWPQASKGYYGGTVSAPAMSQVLDKSLRYLNVPPDMEPGQRKGDGTEKKMGW